MARMLSDFFTPKALSCQAFFKKFPKGPFTQKIEEVDLQEVKRGGDKVLSIKLEKSGVWIGCNQTNAQQLAAKFGQDVDEWVGRKITISKGGQEFQGKRGFDLKPA